MRALSACSLAACTAVGLAALLLAPAGSLAGGSERRAPNGLVYSTASNRKVQRQPAAGRCAARGRGPYSRPDPGCTPGALNPAVTQATIGRTICRRGWTSSVRPPVSITEPEKLASMRAYGDTGSASAYEYDHFIPLELGGATNDPRNLWPEPGASPNPKDAVEDSLNRQVCDGAMTLARAQALIAANWVSLASHSTPTGAAPGSAKARCTALARYNAKFRDYDVFVRSNQPERTVTVTGAGTNATYHTDATGYADVFFHAPVSAAGKRVTVRVGGATCRAALSAA